MGPDTGFTLTVSVSCGKSASVSLSSKLSLPLTKTVAVPPSSISIPSGWATGGLSFSGFTVIVTVCLATNAGTPLSVAVTSTTYWLSPSASAGNSKSGTVLNRSWLPTISSRF